VCRGRQVTPPLKARKLLGTTTGKQVGTVTHVLVNDPTAGYGIFIENMPDAAA